MPLSPLPALLTEDSVSALEEIVAFEDTEEGAPDPGVAPLSNVLLRRRRWPSEPGDARLRAASACHTGRRVAEQ